MQESTTLGAGTVLGAYRIVRCIGIGGMGTVYEAEHCELRKRVALKTPHSETGMSPEGRARFVQEGKTAAKIRHPHVVDITDVGEEGGVAFLVMEYLEGEPLSALIEREGALDACLLADIIVPVAAALHQAHGMGVIHRDLKPDNIFLTRSVQGNIHAKLLDFGVSKVLGDEKVPALTSANTLVGTPQYIAPEQLRDGLASTDKSDQYSLGVVIYEAVTGKNPFVGYTTLISILMAVDNGNFTKPTRMNPEMDVRLEAVVLRAMSVSPSARFPSMAVLGAQLLPMASADTQNAWARYFAENAESVGVDAAGPPRRAVPPRRTPWAMAAGLGLLSAGVVATIGARAYPGKGIEVSVPVAMGEASLTARAEPPRPSEPAPPMHSPPVEGASSGSLPVTPGAVADDPKQVIERERPPLEPPASLRTNPSKSARARAARRHSPAVAPPARSKAQLPNVERPALAPQTDNINPWGS